VTTPDLSTRYLGFALRSPLVASAGPLTGSLESLEALDAAGVGAVVLPSLFEEQIQHDELAVHALHELGTQSFAEALDYLPEPNDWGVGPEAYLRLLREAARRVSVPVIASLNGCSDGGWTGYARRIEEAGGAALELNVYIVPSDIEVSGAEIERRYLDLVAAVRKAVAIPLAVKVGPGFSSPGHMARRLVEAGADGLVLFNRFLRPDMDLESLRLVPSLVLSSPYDARLPLQWIGILHGHVRASLAASSGVHQPSDALKLLLAGADVVMATSALLRHGPGHARVLLDGIAAWMREKEYASVEQLKGSMSLANCPDPGAYQRANYTKTLLSWSGAIG
jgi:dihydroorotate dehydrogenase (fumarate)